MTEIKFNPRTTQQEVLDYEVGKMGIAAVPGSGKTWTLSLLTAKLLSDRLIEDDQEILVVTLVNSAVDNFSQRVRVFLMGFGLMPHLGYRVRTLHGLANDIVRERPELVGLDANFQIIDERSANEIRDNIAISWLNANPGAFDKYINRNLDEGSQNRAINYYLPELVKNIALSFIRSAKDQQLSPQQILTKLEHFSLPLPLAKMGAEMYTDYQRALAYRGVVDFDDLIRYALLTLQLDDELLIRLKHRWPFILEDEAQDSSYLQEEILRLLTGQDGNWVRVGDPNQAIYETFTTANPKYLINFIKEADINITLSHSGRSTLSIINLANHLVEWCNYDHPIHKVRSALLNIKIKPTPEDDPQPNPPDDPIKVYFVTNKYSPVEESKAVADSIARWIPNHPDETIAALVPRNQRGHELIQALKEHKVDVIENLNSTISTRETAGALNLLLQYLADPTSSRKLAKVFQVWQRSKKEDPEAWKQVLTGSEILRKCYRVENYTWPIGSMDWRDSLDLRDINPKIQENLNSFRLYVQRWLKAVILPIDQLILTVSQDVFFESTELALAHKLASLLRQIERFGFSRDLLELAEELAVIARNERRFLGFSEEDTGFDPEKHKGKVVVSTIHKAKGLEWDRVHLLSVNNYDFPSGMPHDEYYSEKWFLQDQINLEAEILGELRALLPSDQTSLYEEDTPTNQARMEYVRERLRLFYVGITRAKKELIVTWNTGRRGNMQPAVPFLELQTYWENVVGNLDKNVRHPSERLEH